MSGILLLAVVALGIVVRNLTLRLNALAHRIDELERVRLPLMDQAASLPVTKAPNEVREPVPAPSARRSLEPVAPVDVPVAAQPTRQRFTRPNLEALIGARLPVWIGAAALIVAGFFLVRYAIESGLLGPGIRTFAAGLFAVALIAASEAARRWPVTAEDPRVAQALAGAGIASAYGALYLAAALYRLVPPLPAFATMLAVTALALVLAMRHGPPTAVLALAGGFAAPLVAGYDTAGIAPLLVYLALFTGALFALAAHRGWPWLAIAATIAGFGWINFLLVVMTGNQGAAAAFAVLLAIAASVALPRAGVASPWLRLAPLVAGLVQLIAFAPALEFSALAWGMYLTLAAAALVLAWRDIQYMPSALAATLLAMTLVAVGLSQAEPGVSLAGAAGVAALFGGTGLVLLARDRMWAVVALGGIAGPLLIANLFEPGVLADWKWGALELGAAALAVWVSWRRREAVGLRDPGLIGGAAAAALLWSVAVGQIAAFVWVAPALAVGAVALGAWARRTGDTGLFMLPALALAAALVAAGKPMAAYVEAILSSVAGERLPYGLLPSLADGLRGLLPVAVAVALLQADSRQFGRLRRAALVGGMLAGLVLLWHVAKLPLAIDRDATFAAWGFVERALISQALLGGGWILLRRTGFGAVGTFLFGLGIARIVWFDLLLLNPVYVQQQVGGIPLLNAAVVHVALAALWCWTFVAGARWRRLGMAFALVAVLALVRQAAHGSVLTGPVTTGENYGYSVALLLLALAWLTAGIRGITRDLRVAGLALLTGVTFKVFLIDAAALDGVLRILSFMGLGVALIAIGWAYRRFLAGETRSTTSPAADGEVQGKP